MITEYDLQEAIAECNGIRNPSIDTCIKLAALYTVQDHMKNKQEPYQMSFASEPNNVLPKFDQDSVFLQTVSGKDVFMVMDAVDELVSTVQLMNSRLYDSFIRSLDRIK